jgi:hypothetical protein
MIVARMCVCQGPTVLVDWPLQTFNPFRNCGTEKPGRARRALPWLLSFHIHSHDADVPCVLVVVAR